MTLSPKMSSLNKRWASIKSLVKEKKLNNSRNVSPASPSLSPSPKVNRVTRRMSMLDGGIGFASQNLKFEIPKTVAELKNDLQSSRNSPKPSRKLLRLNTADQETFAQRSAPSSPVISTPVHVNDKRRLTIAPMAPIYNGNSSNGCGPRNKGVVFAASRDPKSPKMSLSSSDGSGRRSRRQSVVPSVAITFTSVEGDEESNAISEDLSTITSSPSINSMCDPKFWDNPTPDNTLRLKPPQRDRMYNRRRSSAISGSSNEEYETLSRSTYSLCEKGLYEQSKEKILFDRRLSLAPQLALSTIVKRPRRTRSSNRLEARLIAELGELKFSVQYLTEGPGLRVTVIKGENIGGRYKTDAQVNCVVSVMLLPGKIQKQTGKVVRGTKNPFFNEEFIFTGLDWDALETHLLRIAVQNQQRFKNDDLGEVLLPLFKVNPDIENRMWKDVRKKCQNPTQECGYLQIRTRFTKATKKLNILIIKAQDLLRSSLIGPPDTYVRVEVMQSEKRLDRKQTKLVKRTKDPLYKEAFAFTLGVSLEEIKHTSIEITVYAKENLFGSAALGQVILGYGSTEESELRHWSLTMREYGKEFTKWHTLMPIEDKEA